MGEGDMKGITRRSFLQGSALAAAGVAAAGMSGCASNTVPDLENENIYGNGADPFADCETVYGCCSPECQHHCLKGYIRDGKLVKVEAAEINESGICPRGISRTEMVHSDLRLKMPMKRIGPKGSDEFEEISWDEAYDMMVEHINDAIKTDGSLSIAYTGLSGNFSNLTRFLIDPFFSWIGEGCTRLADNICCAGVDAGMTPILGKRGWAPRDQIQKSDYLIAWGNNPAITLGAYFYKFEEALANGATLCTIDPYYSETANRSQEWLQVYPSSDLALGLHMLNTVITEKIYDKEFLLQHTTAPCLVNKKENALALSNPEVLTSYQVYDPKTKTLVAHDAANVVPALSVKGTEFEKQYVTVFDLIAEQAAKVDDETLKVECGIKPEDAKRVARGFAAAKHGMIIHNMGGLQRTEYGAWAITVGTYLSLFTGNIGHEGDGIYDIGGVSHRIPAGTPFEANPDITPAGKLHKTQFGEQILADDPYKINCLFIFFENLASQCPNTNSVKKALEKIPFVVTADLFMTPTCKYSDLVLPVTGVFETENVTASLRSNVISISEAKITPPGEAKSDLQICAGLAERLGFGEKFNEDPSVYINRVLEPYGFDYEHLKKVKAVDTRDFDWIPYKDGVFPTESTKAELFVGAWKESGYPPIPEWRRTKESVNNADKYPLAAAQRKGFRTIHTTFSELETMQKLFGDFPTIFMNDEDAAARGIKDGDIVTAFNDRGEHKGRARVTQQVKKSVVLLENGWQDNFGGSSASNVTNNCYPAEGELPPLGFTHACNSTLVEVRKGE